MRALMLSPEPPYPLNGGGAYRTSSLLHYLARSEDVDLILFSDSGLPATLPPGLVRTQRVIPLSQHSRSTPARFIRNARRAIQGVPPLIDRLSGLGSAVEAAIGDGRYDLCVIEHFWCAPYVGTVRRHCNKVLLDLHNVESVLHARCASVRNIRPPGMLGGIADGLVRLGHRRFASVCRELEKNLLPEFSAILTPSEEDARLVRSIVPGTCVEVYPNALPWASVPVVPSESQLLVFAGNFEYHPNIDAIGYFLEEIWPELRARNPGLRLRLVGRGDAYIRRLLPPGQSSETGVEVTGAVEDARTDIARATVVVAPIRTGSGTRIKILEAWAAGRCVVATPLAAEGLNARDDVNIAIEASATGFAARVTKLLADDAARQRLAAAGRRTFENSYCWEAAWRQLDSRLQVPTAPGLDRYTGNS